MAESWVRLWAGMTTDPKWQTVARKSGQPRALVIALFTHLMLEANEADDRGAVLGIDIEDIASALDCDEEAVEAILDAMNGRVIEDGRLSGWDRRQPKREDSGDERTGAMSSTERSRLHRERKRGATQCNARNDDATQCNAPEAEAEAEADTGVLKRASTTEPDVARENDSGAPASPTAAGEVCKRLKAAGITGVNPSHPKLLALLDAGLTADEIAGIAREPAAAGKGFAWILAAAEGRRRDAATVRPLPRASPSGVAQQNRDAIERAKAKILASEAAREAQHSSGDETHAR